MPPSATTWGMYWFEPSLCFLSSRCCCCCCCCADASVIHQVSFLMLFIFRSCFQDSVGYEHTRTHTKILPFFSSFIPLTPCKYYFILFCDHVYLSISTIKSPVHTLHVCLVWVVMNRLSAPHPDGRTPCLIGFYGGRNPRGGAESDWVRPTECRERENWNYRHLHTYTYS